MRRTLRWVVRALGVLVFLIGVVWLVGPREPIDTSVRFEARSLGDDLDGYLAKAEAVYSDLTDGVQKRIVWAGEPGIQTELAIVYLHGWGATSEEIRPVPDRVAAHFGANLYFARLKGHGRPSSPLAMSEPTMNDWVQDTAEALAIGSRLGKRVVVIGTSTGASLAVMAAGHDELKADLAGIVLVSPNFGPADPLAGLANWPLARYWVPALVGEWREWEPHNADQAKYWTTRTQNVAALPMMALVKHVGSMNLGEVDTPALFIYSEEDTVVSPALTAAAAAAWGGARQVEKRVMTEGDTPSHHVIAGDIMSPNQTADTIRVIIDWVAAL